MKLSGRSRAILTALLTAAFAIIASSLPPKGGFAADVAVATWLMSRVSEQGAVAATWVSWLGDTALSGLLAAAVVFLLVRRRPAAAITVVIATIGGMLIADGLKPIFHRPRPEYALEIMAGRSFSFPSGHSMASIVGYGIVAYFRLELEAHSWRRRLILVPSCVIILAVGFSRLYLGVHYLTDVIGGFLAGAVWVLLCTEVYRYATRAIRARGAARR